MKREQDSMISGGNFSPKTYLQHHWQSFRLSMHRMRQSPVASFLTVMVIAIALVLPASFIVLLENVHTLSKNWDQGTQVSLYLEKNISQDQVGNLLSHLRMHDDVESVSYISPEDGLQTFEKASGMQNIIDQLSENPLPPVIEVHPSPNVKTEFELNVFVASMEQQPHVLSAQLDLQWLQRLFAIVTLLKHGAMAVMILFAVAVLLVVGNTIRLATQSYQQEMTVMQLIGATDAMVRRPFLYTGFTYGFLGALCAWVTIVVLYSFLSPSFAHLMHLYHSQYQLLGIDVEHGLLLLGVASFLGLFGAAVAVRACLRQREIMV